MVIFHTYVSLPEGMGSSHVHYTSCKHCFNWSRWVRPNWHTVGYRTNGTYRYHHITYISFAFICHMIKYIRFKWIFFGNMDTQFAHICIIKSGDWVRILIVGTRDVTARSHRGDGGVGGGWKVALRQRSAGDVARPQTGKVAVAVGRGRRYVQLSHRIHVWYIC